MDNIFFLSCFLPLALVAHWVIPGVKGKNAVLLVFSLLYTPCVAAVAAIRREMGTKWAVGVVIWQCVLAWLAAFAIYVIGGMIGI